MPRLPSPTTDFKTGSHPALSALVRLLAREAIREIDRDPEGSVVAVSDRNEVTPDGEDYAPCRSDGHDPRLG